MSTTTMPLKSKHTKKPEVPTVEGMAAPLKTSDRTITDLSAVFKLLADKSRLKIVLALAQEGKMHVTALCSLLGQSQPAVSHHLTLMRMVGLIKFDRNGKHNYYYLDSTYLRELLAQFFSDAGNGQGTVDFEDFSLTFKDQTTA